MVVEADPAPDTRLGLRSGLPSVQIDAFILEGAPKMFDEDIVKVSGDLPLALPFMDILILARFRRPAQMKDVNSDP
jgi:hypothetical protein